MEVTTTPGWSMRAIAHQMGRHHSTIAREISRGVEDQPYKADRAQEAYHVPFGKYTPALGAELREKLEKTWSPEQVAEKRRHTGQSFVCFKTISRWLYDGRLAVSETQVLRHKG